MAQLKLAILKAAATLKKPDTEFFSLAELVVAAWKLEPQLFCLTGFPEHPDSNKVLSNVHGALGLVRAGMMQKVDHRKYRLTTAGWRATTVNPSPHPSPRNQPAAVPSVDVSVNRVRALMDSVAYKKYVTDRKANIRYTDALAFWGLPIQVLRDTTPIAKLSRLLGEMVEKYGPNDHGVILDEGPPVLRVGDVHVVKHVHFHLIDQFKARLTIGGES